MMALYGKHFLDMWAGSDLEMVKDIWAKRLAGYSKDELKMGLIALGKRTYCPTLPDFMLLCRPPLEYHTAFIEAVKNLELRETGTDKWEHPAIFWAAIRVGAYDMRHMAYSGLEKRWKRALDDAMEGCSPVPESRLSLPPIGRTVTTAEEGRKKIAKIVEELHKKMEVKND